MVRYVESAIKDFVLKNFEKVGKMPIYLDNNVALYRKGDVVITGKINKARVFKCGDYVLVSVIKEGGPDG